MPTDAVILQPQAAERQSIGESLKKSGVSRRDFISLCSMLMATAPMGLALTENAKTPEQLAKVIAKAKKPVVVWLHFQDCTGCTETLLRTSRPDVADLILNVISLDYHETLMVASGYQAEKCLKDAVEQNAGKFILVCEGSIPTKDGGQYLTLAGVKGIDRLKEVASKAAAIVSMGSCASWGGVPSADPNPTGAVGIDQIIKDKPVVNIPGCPPNPYNLLGVVLEYVIMGKLPALDQLGRPKFAYDRLIHDHCPRRAHFDAGRFVKDFGDDGHKQGWCLYKMGCKGPATHASCSTSQFNEMPDCWPIGLGTPCVGCTEKSVAFRVPIFQTIDIHGVTPPDTYPLINARVGSIGTVAAAVAGAVAGGIGTAAWMAAQKLPGGTQPKGPADSDTDTPKEGGQ